MVVDYCPHCGELSAFRVVDTFRVSHLYFVPLGHGRYQFSVVLCRRCRETIEFDDERYGQVVRSKVAQNLDFEELLRRSRPTLSARLDAIDGLCKPPVERPAYRAQVDEASVALLSEARDGLRWLEWRGIDTTRWIERLRDWPRIGLNERETLLGELRRHAARREAG